MTVHLDTEESPDQHPGSSPPPQGHIVGIPYDLKRPTVAKCKGRSWNPGDPHFFTPKVFGVGWTINFYWLRHPLRYLKGRRTKP